MSGTREPWEFDDDGDAGEQNPVKQMRSYIKKLEKERDDLRTENDALKPQLRSRNVIDNLTALGVKNAAKVAKYVPSDIDATKEGLTAWVTEDGDVFGIKLGESTETETPAGEQQTPPGTTEPGQEIDPRLMTENPSLPLGYDQTDLAALRQMDFTTQTAVPADQLQSVAAQIANASSVEELNAILSNPLAAR